MYRTTDTPAMPRGPNAGAYLNGVAVEPPTVQIYSSNIQLSSVPDKLIIFIRKPVATQNCTDADFFATITNITITWNNQCGLSASMTSEQLYRNSIQSGLTGLTWDQLSGRVVSVGANAGDPNGKPCSMRSPYFGCWC